ncbi:hypothetical protein BDV30DRAFT_221955 [Aspergillus minisclerotigenes]|uniref:Uncharacterized protein n=1 Tax=Aspergillus minisclerotigenes TaxID=656917 RepID=A0A5N6IKM4_9EURO|nr:hypothetical protein BDV30DRAFT_221955 [Aspergillus minisclerotigenes]
MARRLTTNQEIAGSTPASVIFLVCLFFAWVDYLLYPSRSPQICSELVQVLQRRCPATSLYFVDSPCSIIESGQSRREPSLASHCTVDHSNLVTILDANHLRLRIHECRSSGHQSDSVGHT